MRSAGRADAVSVVTRTIVSPGVRLFDDFGNAWTAQWTALSSGPKLYAELARLRKVEAAAKLYGQTVDGLRRELSQLRALNDLPNYGREHVSARIIGYFPYQNRFTLSVGSQQGVTVGMPVVDPQGLLGIVQTVERDSCQALVISSPVVKLGGLVQRTPEVVGLMKGQTPTRLVLDVLDNGSVEPGDPVVTSGLGNRIPRGIPVGTVAEVVPDPNYGTRRVFVAPSAQIGPTIEVTVLK